MADKKANALEMSDDEFLKMDPSQFEEQEDDVTATDDQDHDETDESVDDTTEEAGAADETDDTTEQDTTDEEEDSEEEDLEGESKEEDKDNEEEQDLTDDKGDEKAEQQDNTSSDSLTETQFAEIGRQIMSEFKANGATLKMKSAEDAIRLMQMGANYHKKMSGLKPSLKVLKLLENNDLLDTDKLNYLIDLNQKKPEAIKQLLRDSKLDPMELDLEEGNQYVPEQRTVNDKDLLLDEVLDNASSSPYYQQALTVIGEKWDEPSRRVIANDPMIISTIIGHMESGIFDQVMRNVNYDKSLGKLTGLSDFDAYQQVGAYMHENNMFTHANDQSTDQGSNQQRRQEQSQGKVNDEREEARRSKKKAASPSRQRQAPDKKEEYNPLEMSDEEFAKLNNLRL